MLKQNRIVPSLFLATTVLLGTATQLQTIPLIDSSQLLGDGSTTSVNLGDLDGDGDLDAFVGNAFLGNGALDDQVWLNDGAGNFTDSGQGLIGADRGITILTDLGDVDGDGDLDAAVAYTCGFGGCRADADIFKNDGSGNFTLAQHTDVNSWRGVKFGDLDGDLDLDLVVSSFSQLSIMLNDGTGFFTVASTLNTGEPWRVGLGDLDGDLDLDLFVNIRNGARQVWLNDGTGSFSDTLQALGSSVNNFALALGDIDGDGDLDAFSGAGFGRNEVWLNDGLGFFTLGQSMTTGGIAAEAKLGDLDRDGDLDAVVALADVFNEGQATEAFNEVWLNDGSGFYTLDGTLGFATPTRGLDIGDLDGDGDLDVFFGNGYSTIDDAAPNQVFLNSPPADLDSDGDGVSDLDDNCPVVANPGQEDFDGDGTGDACDSDGDGDGVDDFADDLCPFTARTDPDAGVPSIGLGQNRWADMDGDTQLDTNGKNPTGRLFTIYSTGGCNCAQIIEICGYGQGHVQFGCSNSVMDWWTGLYDRDGMPPFQCQD